MKRMAMMIAAAALACTAGAMGVAAAGRGGHGMYCNGTAACAFVDENGDGVCDYRTGGCRYDADGDGLCDARPAGGCGGHRACRAAQ